MWRYLHTPAARAVSGSRVAVIRFQGVERALASLWRFECEKGVVCWQSIQEGEQRRNRLLEGGVECQHLAGHLGPNGPGIVAVVHVDVALEEINHREVCRSLAIGDRGALKNTSQLRV